MCMHVVEEMKYLCVCVCVQDKHSGSGLKSPAEFEMSGSKVVLHKKVEKTLFTLQKGCLSFNLYIV